MDNHSVVASKIEKAPLISRAFRFVGKHLYVAAR